MARPNKLPQYLKRNRIDIWFDDADFDWIDAMAKQRRTNRSDIIRDAVARLVEQDLQSLHKKAG